MSRKLNTIISCSNRTSIYDGGLEPRPYGHANAGSSSWPTCKKSTDDSVWTSDSFKNKPGRNNQLACVPFAFHAGPLSIDPPALADSSKSTAASCCDLPLAHHYACWGLSFCSICRSLVRPFAVPRDLDVCCGNGQDRSETAKCHALRHSMLVSRQWPAKRVDLCV